MFPLEEYAPKSSVGVNNYFSSPDQQSFVSFSNKEKVNSKIDELIIKLGEETALVTLDADNQGAKIEKEKKSEPIKAAIIPSELSEEDKPFILPKLTQSDLADIKNSKKDLYNPKPVEIIMPEQVADSQIEDKTEVERGVIENNLKTEKLEKEVAQKKATQKETSKEPKKELAAVEKGEPVRVFPVGNLPWLKDKKSEQNETKQIAEKVAEKEPEVISGNIDEEFEKIKLGLLPIAKEKVQAKPINTAEIVFPVNNPVEDEFSPIDLAAPLQKVGAIKVGQPLLEVPEISKITKSQPQFEEKNFAKINEEQNFEQKQYFIQEDVPPQASQGQNVAENAPFYEQPQQIVVVTPAKNEYVAPPIVNIRKQFEEYRKENSSSGYRLLRGSRYSDRRNLD